MHRRQHKFIGRKRRVNGTVRLFSFPKERLPRRVDLSRLMSQIEDQGDFNTCSANAVACICEYLFKQYSHRDYDVSRLFIYYNGRIIDEKPHRVWDGGVDLRNVILGMRRYGLCQEKYWPYDQRSIDTKPSEDVYRRAREYTVVPLHIPSDIKAIETCLHHQIPVPISIFITDDIGNIVEDNRGRLTLPGTSSSHSKITGLHTVLLVGYDRSRRYFIARNSWGGYWGQHGYFHLSYNYITNPHLHDPNDGLWTILRIAPRTQKLPAVRQLVL